MHCDDVAGGVLKRLYCLDVEVLCLDVGVLA